MTSSALLAPPPGPALVASASTSLREQVLHSLHDRSWPVQVALGGADALVKLESGDWQVLFLDRRLPDLDAEELIQIIKRRFPGIAVVMLDSDTCQASSVLLPDTGKFDSNNLALQDTSPPHLLPFRRESRAEVQPLPGMIGRSEPMQRVYQLARLVAPRVTTVLITGPTGTGKELVARALHELSSRAGRPFVVVNCAAIPESLLESELFGHVRGAFTGAVQTSPGRIHAAQGGTLFLDEIGELPLSVQAKLLRFLDQKEVQRLGSPETFRVDVRVIAATNADLECCIEAKTFRQDLYYRLSAFPLELPRLAERAADILPLAEHFLRLVAGPNYLPAGLSQKAIRLLESHGWNGNVRELQQVIERAAILADGARTILGEHIYFPAAGRRTATREV